MKSHCHSHKNHLLQNLVKLRGLWFHLIGLAAIVWFVIRVVPAPHRARYPCQQVSITVALGYIAFWGALFTGLKIWLRHAKWKTSKAVPVVMVIFIVLISVSGAVFALNFFNDGDIVSKWDPVPKEPIGIPKGANPGRVVWTWNPDATEKELTEFWWEKDNNNQDVIDQMYSDGIQALAGATDDYSAWDILFTYFNEVHGNGDVGYQPGEKIAIKINMNNGYFEDYESKINDIDANPYVMKGLLRQLVTVVGVAEEDITVYDASRKLMDWFYNRVYYEEYPATPLVPEFANVHFVDSEGGAVGREQVVPSSERVYFADGSCAYRTLPTVVTEADYLINMPITKRHVGDRVTLAGKNWFGSWIEDVVSVHDYHEIGYAAMGNPAPQTDLFAHEQLGGKTLLLIGDGTYGCRYGNSDISRFQMYPFNDDWMSSLLFSQDSVAIDSVMYDFLHTEGTGPSEGAQNYLHQAAEPPLNVYDPENDGKFLSESLGVHEHWDTNLDIFSVERYSGQLENGIDYTPLGEEHASPGVSITKPKEKHLYLAGKEVRYLSYLPKTIILGKIDIETEVNGISGEIEKVEFIIDGVLKHTDVEEPYQWSWNNRSFFRHDIETKVYFDDKTVASDTVVVWKFF